MYPRESETRAALSGYRADSWVFFCLPGGVGVQSGEHVYVAGRRPRCGFRAGRVDFREICSAAEVAHDGAGRCPERDRDEEIAHNRFFGCAAVVVGGFVTFYKLVGRKSAAKWRSPASILDIDEAGDTAEVQR